MSKRSLVPVNILALASAPSGAHVGDMYINTTDYTLNVYDGTAWSATYLTQEAVSDLISNATLGNTDDLAEGINNKYFTVTRLVDTLNAGTLQNISFTYDNGAINTSVPTVQGATGTQGIQGHEGPQGAIGTQGTTGMDGAQGPEGPQGVQGSTGTEGMQGATGSTGAQGTTGSTGETGTQGTQGTQGVTGDVGVQGPQGPQGAEGLQGAQGTTGAKPWTLIGAYDNGVSYNYDDAVTYEGGFYYRTGNPLNPGYPPTPGSANSSWTPVADRGAQGTQGTQGTIGTQGETGTQGPEGMQGVLGAQGPEGPQGTTGTQGATGTQGVQGPEGTQGTTGAQGVQGIQGYQGADGNSSSYYSYQINTGATSGDPGNGGYILYNNATQTSATQLIIDHLTATDVDIDIFLALLKAGDTLIIQDANDSDNYQQWEVSGNETIYPNNYAEVPVTLVASNGTGTTGFSNNHQVILVVIAAGVQGPTGAQGTTGTQGVQGLQGATGTISPDDSWYYSILF